MIMKYFLIALFIIGLALGVYYLVEASDSGALSPGTMADDATVGTVAWTNPNNAKVSDNVYATAAVAFLSVSHYLKATNFGFSIPVGATINGILVEVERKGFDDIDFVRDNAIKIVKGGTIGATDKSSLDNWPVSDAYKSYGSSSDLWGETWTPAQINASDFGFVVSVKDVSGESPGASVDHIRITVYYTAAAGGGSQTMVSPVIIFE